MLSVLSLHPQVTYTDMMHKCGWGSIPQPGSGMVPVSGAQLQVRVHVRAAPCSPMQSVPVSGPCAFGLDLLTGKTSTSLHCCISHNFSCLQSYTFDRKTAFNTCANFPSQASLASPHAFLRPLQAPSASMQDANLLMRSAAHVRASLLPEDTHGAGPSGSAVSALKTSFRYEQCPRVMWNGYG